MKDSDSLDRSLRWTARTVGWFFHAAGLLVLSFPLIDKRSIDNAPAIGALGLGLFLVGVPFSGLGGALRRLWRRASARRLLRSLTQTLGSAAEPSEDLSSIRWVGSREGNNVALSWSIDGPSTQVAIEIKGGSPGTLRILPTWSRGGRLIRGRSIPTGHPDFDRQFLARSEPPSLIGDLFSGDRREFLARSIFYLPDATSCRVILTLSDLRIRLPRVVGDGRTLKRLFYAAENFATAIQEAMREAGYSVVSVGAGTSARCPVCISPLEEKVVLCLRCRTPHHQGCWEYAGECALFACGGRRWIRP